jgi:thiol-disulfide isomerase/thioredoxin
MPTKTVLLLLTLVGLAAGTTSRTAQASVAAPAKTTLQSTDGKQIDWDDLLHHYTGKVIYVDLWASWCGPCREQAPYYQTLKRQFMGDSVVFLSISIDADPQDWTDALQSLGQAADPESFLLLDGHHSSLNAVLHIKGVPRYVLLDKTGHMTDKDAPFPSDPQIAARIRALM